MLALLKGYSFLRFVVWYVGISVGDIALVVWQCRKTIKLQGKTWLVNLT